MAQKSQSDDSNQRNIPRSRSTPADSALAGERIFVEFFIPPPPPQSSDSDSSESETQSQDGGIEIDGIHKDMNILDVSTAFVERANNERTKRKSRAKGRMVINVNSIFSGSSDSEDLQSSETVSIESPFSVLGNSDGSSRVQEIPEKHRAERIDPKTEDSFPKSYSPLLPKELKIAPPVIEIPPLRDSSPESRQGDAPTITHDLSDLSASLSPVSQEDENQSPIPLERVAIVETHSDDEDTKRVSPRLVLPLHPRSTSPQPYSKSPHRSKSPRPSNSPRSSSPIVTENGHCFHSPTPTNHSSSSLSPKENPQSILEKVLSPRPDEDEQPSTSRHSSPYDKTSPSSPMELAQDLAVMMNKSPGGRSPLRTTHPGQANPPLVFHPSQIASFSEIPEVSSQISIEESRIKTYVSSQREQESKNSLLSPDETASSSVTNTMSATPIPEDDDVLNAVPLSLDNVMEPTQPQEEEKLDLHGLYHRNRRSVSISGLAIHDSISRKKSELIRLGKIEWRE